MSNPLGRSRSRSRSRPCHSGFGKRYQSRRKSDYSVSPRRRAEHPRSPKNLPRDRDGDEKGRSFSPDNGNGADQNPSNGCAEKAIHMSEADRGKQKSSPSRASKSPQESR
ncbi:unnamed protein product [Lupinus luteus]|uniref:Uncharacterized protein n=1 Tax=Lupinus luteus TaxID=3873 RepID=A0AAV1WE82_LUPLU